MTTEESNKLIAEFMGGENYPKLIPYTPEPDDIWFNVSQHPEVRHPDNHSMWKLNELKYHTSWDWLMPVVEKIEEIGFMVTTMGTTKSIGKHRCVISSDPYVRKGENHVIFIEEETRFQAAYQAVIQFIKWYNKQLT